LLGLEKHSHAANQLCSMAIEGLCESGGSSKKRKRLQTLSKDAESSQANCR
jgi:hypothetical protein